MAVRWDLHRGGWEIRMVTGVRARHKDSLPRREEASDAIALSRCSLEKPLGLYLDGCKKKNLAQPCKPRGQRRSQARSANRVPLSALNSLQQPAQLSTKRRIHPTLPPT